MTWRHFRIEKSWALKPIPLQKTSINHALATILCLDQNSLRILQNKRLRYTKHHYDYHQYLTSRGIPTKLVNSIWNDNLIVNQAPRNRHRSLPNARSIFFFKFLFVLGFSYFTTPYLNLQSFWRWIFLFIVGLNVIIIVRIYQIHQIRSNDYRDSYIVNTKEMNFKRFRKDFPFEQYM